MYGNKKQSPLSPIRKKFLCIFLPVWCTATLVPLIVICVLAAIHGEEKYEPHILIWTACTLGTGLTCLGIFLPWINRKEALERELDRYSYLWKDPKPLTENEVKIQDENAGMTYTLTQEGIAAEWEQDGEAEEQVFDEVQENRLFLPWEQAELLFASQKGFYCVHIALAVVPGSTAEAEEFFSLIPMEEKLFQAICAFGLKEKLDGQWQYLFYNPQDAVKQIMKRGRILEMRNKKTGKLFVDKHGNFLGDQK